MLDVDTSRTVISIHAPHTRSDGTHDTGHHEWNSISIHAPHTRSDHSRILPTSSRRHFNPRSSYEERRRTAASSSTPGIFQSTLLIRGATDRRHRVRPGDTHFNPRSSYEERPVIPLTIRNRDNFNPRSSYEERQHLADLTPCPCRISIHAPHTRSDGCTRPCRTCCLHFNPRSSYEERHPANENANDTHSISIHAPHTRSDAQIDSVWKTSFQFQSTLLIRGATRSTARKVSVSSVFQSTLLIRGAT